MCVSSRNTLVAKTQQTSKNNKKPLRLLLMLMQIAIIAQFPCVVDAIIKQELSDKLQILVEEMANKANGIQAEFIGRVDKFVSMSRVIGIVEQIVQISIVNR